MKVKDKDKGWAKDRAKGLSKEMGWHRGKG